jgi:hypothetical protein
MGEMLPTQTESMSPRVRLQREPAVALAALVAVLNLSVLAGRLGGRTSPHRGDVLAWRAPMTAITGPAGEAASSEKPPSNPTRYYNAGTLSLNTGIAVIALAAWLGVMRINGARGQ